MPKDVQHRSELSLTKALFFDSSSSQTQIKPSQTQPKRTQPNPATASSQSHSQPNHTEAQDRHKDTQVAVLVHAAVAQDSSCSLKAARKSPKCQNQAHNSVSSDLLQQAVPSIDAQQKTASSRGASTDIPREALDHQKQAQHSFGSNIAGRSNLHA